MNASVHRQLAQRKRRIQRRLGARQRRRATRADARRRQHPLRTRRPGPAPSPPAASAPSICWPNAPVWFATSTQNLHLLKRHLPYHESDHVLNIAYNILAGGTRIEHLELRRNDEVYLDALGAERIPDPTTAGDFCRRFRTRRCPRL